MSKIIRLLLILSLPFVLFCIVGSLLGGVAGALFGLIFFGMFSIVSYFYSGDIILRMYGAKLLSRDKYSNIYKTVKELSETVKCSDPNLYLVEADTPSAFVCGMRKPFSIVVTTGFVQVCDEREVEAVVAREFAQISGGYVFVSTLSAVLSLVILYPFELLLRYGEAQNASFGAVLRVPVMLIAPLSALFVRMSNRSSFFMELDSDGAKLSKKPACLVSALKKISREVKHRPLKFGSHATSALFISNPFNGSLVSRLFLVHPSISERIARLEKLVV